MDLSFAESCITTWWSPLLVNPTDDCVTHGAFDFVGASNYTLHLTLMIYVVKYLPNILRCPSRYNARS